MTDIFALTTSCAWRKLNRLCAGASQAQETGENSAKFNAINYLSLAPYSTEDGNNYLAEIANEDVLAACNLSLYRASLLFTYKHVINKDFQRAHVECCQAISNLEAGLNRLGITTELEQHDLTKRARGFVYSLASQAELQQARIKSKIASHLVFVLGMHRSGTSAITGMLAQAGFAAPLDQMPANTVNPKGFWESLSIVKLNEDFLEKMESHWSSSLPLPAGWDESISAREWRTDLINTISEVFKGEELPTIKDPRFCLLIPGLEPWLESRLIDTSFIIPIRNPLEVYNSLLKAQGTDLHNALRLWIHSILTAERVTRGYGRTFISFDILIQDPTSVLEACLKMVAAAADRENTASIANYESKARHEAFDQATAFIDKSLKRQRADITEKDFSETGSTRDTILIKLASEIYRAILSHIADDESISRVLDEIAPRLVRALA
ncbi:MAG: hypothetical protein NTY67_01355 [Cyanobacteria bacterium]|nr:hypothetical protein [Cyanobacteriota bacterium]